MAEVAAPHGPSSPPPNGALPLRRALVATGLAIGVLLAVVAVAALFLAPYYQGRFTTPFGFDTPHYIWRSNLVIARGLDGLKSIGAELHINPNVDRAAFPVFASVVSHVVGVDPSLLAYLVPSVFAAAFGLSAGSFAREVLEEPRWSVPVYVVVAGGSLYITRTAVGSFDNLTVDAVLMAGATAALLCGARRRGGIAAIFRFVGAFMIHWIFAALFMLLMLGVAAVLLPESFLRRRRGEALWNLPSLRIGGIVAAAVGGGLVGLRLTPEFTTRLPVVPIDTIEQKMRQRMPLLKVPLSMALAILGATALWWPRSTLRRWGLALLGLWALSIPAALLLYRIRRHHFPAFRVSEFALALPILAAALVVVPARIARDRGRWRYAGAAVSGVAAAVAIVLTLVASRNAWEVTPSLGGQIMVPPQSVQIATASDYLRQVDAEDPVIFITSVGRYVPADRVIRAGMPGYLIPSIRTFVGRTEDLLAGRPTVSDIATIRSGAKISWPGVQEVLDEPYIALYLSTLNRAYPPPAGASEIASGIFLIRGPEPPGPVLEASPPGFGKGRLAAGVILMLVFLVVAGLGWTAGLVDASWMGRLGLAPAFGLAAVTLASLPVAFLGGPIGRAPSWAIFAGTALLGWLVFAAVSLLGHGGEPDPQPVTEPGP